MDGSSYLFIVDEMTMMMGKEEIGREESTRAWGKGEGRRREDRVISVDLRTRTLYTGR